MEEQIKKDFKDWIDSDNVVKNVNGYVTQCTQYRKTFNYEELMKYFVREYSE